MEESKETCWRKQMDENVKRLHSLLFGVDLALEKKEYSSAQILGLRLIGFLESHCHSDVDDAFIRPIHREVLSKIDVARRSLIPDSDRRAFEQAKKAPGSTFGGDIDIEKIKQSKYFQALLKQSEGTADNQLGDQLWRLDKTGNKGSKVMTQTKLPSLYGNNTLRANNGSKSFLNSKINNSEDCMIVERPVSDSNHTKGHGISSFVKVDEDERAYANHLGAKRAHLESSSSRINNVKSPTNNEIVNADVSGDGFVTARAKLELDSRQKQGMAGSPSASVSPQCDNNRGYGGKSYGVSRRGTRGNFVPPVRSNGSGAGNMTSRIAGKSDDVLDDSTKRCLEILCGPDGELPEKLRNLEPRLIEHVSNEIMDRDPNVRWNDIAGLEHAKKCVTEMVIWPLLRPDIFQGCRSPGRGLLLFGPPGTGKTMIGKAIAGEAKATFFYISASSLTSKWIGEGEKLVRALFGVASCRQPAVIFVDEIDSLLSQRKSDGEHESSRRLKTQFLIEMEGFDSGSEQILLIGATNRPQELDEAARRRLTKRLYIPLPSPEARAWIVRNLLDKDGLFKLSKEEIDTICNLTQGYSGSDMKNLVKDASMGPLREALRRGIEITKLRKEDMRPVILQDFEDALQEVRPSVSSNELGSYDEWNKQFGSLAL
ncbi:Katanin p60 atpase-containing subunit a1 [Quillaja saponaria]|uniref:Katanin p60 atpase-containing subunit a1 n=1 Tax=Quillaja saponaria TaxID=32244 RepID=A0AAD7VGG5_QUISA|nr:Katanin p60 atpase-containing subunit a1 [Quillaja saponaria]